MSVLALEQAPPASAPFRFFFTAPLYGAAAGALLALRAEQVLATRWAPESLAVVHLLVLGFMLQVMAGALLQFMPVAAGATVWRPLWVAGVTHVGLNAGTLALVAGFLGAGQVFFRFAAVTLLITLLAFCAALAVGLWRSQAIGPTLLALRVAVGALVVTVAFGFTLAAAMGWGWQVALFQLAQVHAAWGLLGWALVLLAGVAGLVVPMFQLTPPYPVRFARAVPLAVVAALLLWTAGILFDFFALAWAGALLGATAMVAFAVKTLVLQARRRRRVADNTLTAWRVGMVCLLGSAVLGVWLWAGSAPFPQGRLEYLLGALLLGGAFPAVIAGMLYKIVPFLVWLHLSRVVRSPPHMNLVIDARRQRWQLGSLGAAVLALVLGAFAPPLAAAGGALFALSCALLLWNLLGALVAWRRALVPPPMSDAQLSRAASR